MLSLILLHGLHNNIKLHFQIIASCHPPQTMTYICTYLPTLPSYTDILIVRSMYVCMNSYVAYICRASASNPFKFSYQAPSYNVYVHMHTGTMSLSMYLQ